MDNLLQRLQEANRTATKLEWLILRIKQENDQLLKKVSDLSNQLEDKGKDLDEMVEKYEAMKLVKSISADSNGNQDAVHEKIELYLKEIDICLKNFGE